MTGGDSMVISLRLSELDFELVKRSAMNRDLSVSAFIREAVLEHIECEYLKTIEKEEVMQKEEME